MARGVASLCLPQAVLLASTKDMDGLQSSDQASFDGVPLEPPPGMRQGFGRMNTRGIPLEVSYLPPPPPLLLLPPFFPI